MKLKLANLQFERLRCIVEMNTYLLAYDTDRHDQGDIEVLETVVKDIYYPLTFKTEKAAATYASWFKEDSFINLRPVAVNEIFMS